MILLRVQQRKCHIEPSGSLSLYGDNMAKEIGVLAGKASKDLELLKRHVTMLQFVADNEPIGIIKLAELMELPQHKVRYSLRLLEKDGLIKASTNGAKTTRKVEKFLEDLKEHLAEMNSSVKEVQKGVDRLRKSVEK